MSTEKNKKLNGINYKIKTILVVGTIIMTTVCISLFMYKYTQDLLKQRLQERLVSIVSTASTRFTYDELSMLPEKRDENSIELKSVIEKLNEIRNSNQDIQFIYLMKKTEDPNFVKFITDADSLTPIEDLDVNSDGVIDEDEEVPLPGDLYEISEFPVLKSSAFNEPSVDNELYPDQWGLMMAAYAPVFDNNGNPYAIIGVDVLIDDFYKKTQATLLPFILFIAGLVLLLVLLTVALFRMNQSRVKAMQDLDRQKDELLSIVSHQLATPVSSMNFSLEMMQDGDFGKLSSDQNNMIGKLRHTVTNLTDLINMILDVSRIQLGRMRVDKAPLNLNEFVKDVVELMNSKAVEHKVAFNVDIKNELPEGEFDKRLMRMTLENLLSNAIKYTPEGGSVDFTAEYTNGIFKYIVKDTGCGIPESEHSKMFQKLYRATNVRNNVNGNGFGLYVAKGSVEAHNGKIWFDSKEGEGTTFYVEIPVKI